MKKHDLINHPSHYTQSSIECIDGIKSALGREGFHSFLKGQVIKYLWRADHKGRLEDLKKAQWYLDRLIKES